MGSGKDHTILIVDDEKSIGEALQRLARQIGIRSVYVNSAEEAVSVIKSAGQPFSLILSDHRMPGMSGTAFLEKAKEITPDTVRFLITGFADRDAVADAVNRGAVHRFITKPWDNYLLAEMIKSALEYHDLLRENSRLFILAKKQNSQLFVLYKELKKKTDTYKKKVAVKDREIARLREQMTIGQNRTDYIDDVETMLMESRMLTEDRMADCCRAVTEELFSQFQALAKRSGFLMPGNSASG